MKVSFLTQADSELNDAFYYYESVQKSLGFRFLKEINHCLSRIEENPKSYQKISKQSRRCLVYKFPYSIIYRYNQSNEDIIVIAIAHLYQKSNYWISRIL